MSGPYCTPDGHAVTQARQPRQAIEMLDEGRRHLGASFDAGLHQVDAPARRVHLLAPQQIRRTGRQTEAAMDALVDQRGTGSGRCAGLSLAWALGSGSWTLESDSLDRPAAGVENPAGSNVVFQRARGVDARSPAGPTHRLRASTPAPARSTTTLPTHDARAEPLDAATVRRRVAVEAQQSRAGTDPAGHRDTAPRDLLRRRRIERRDSASCAGSQPSLTTAPVASPRRAHLLRPQRRLAIAGHAASKPPTAIAARTSICAVDRRRTRREPQQQIDSRPPSAAGRRTHIGSSCDAASAARPRASASASSIRSLERGRRLRDRQQLERGVDDGREACRTTRSPACRGRSRRRSSRRCRPP